MHRCLALLARHAEEYGRFCEDKDIELNRAPPLKDPAFSCGGAPKHTKKVDPWGGGGVPYIYLYVCMHVYMWIHMCAYVSLYISIHVRKYLERERHTTHTQAHAPKEGPLSIHTRIHVNTNIHICI